MKTLRPRLLALAALSAACGNTGAPPDAGAPGELAPSASAAAASSVVAAPASASASSAPIADVSAHASEKYEPGPSLITSGGAVDGAALRKRHIERLKSDTSAVTVLTGEGPLDLGKRICEAVVPKRPAATPILLKPNLCGFDSIKDPKKYKGDDGVHGRSTDVAFTRGVVQCLKARGHKAITIAEGCGISHKHWQNVISLLGYDSMAREEGVKLVAMDDDGVYDVEGDQPGKPLAINGIASTHVPNLLLPKVLAEHLDKGMFISLPKVKAHRYSVVSLAIKGMQGTVMLSDKPPAYKQKWRMHKELNEYLDLKKGKDKDGNPVEPKEDRALYMASLRAFAERMVDVLEISTPDVVLCDGAPGMNGDGFQRLYPSPENVAIGGTNPVLVDRVGSAFLGLYNQAALGRELGGSVTSPLITIAARRYGLDLAKTSIIGDGAALLNKPRPVHFKGLAPFQIDYDPPGSPPSKPFEFPPSGIEHGGGDSASPPSSVAPSAPPPSAAPPVAPPAPPSSSSNKPSAHAASLGADAIKIDGRGDDAAWARAPKVTWETDYSGKKTGITTAARFLWHKTGLYVLFELSGAGLHVDTSHPTDVERKGLYNEDCAEVFIAPDPAKPKHYYEVELGPFGHFFDIEIDRDRGKQNTAWSGALKVATTRDPRARTAVIEALIAAPEIAGALSGGARLPLGLYRMEGTGERSYLAWSPPRTPKPNFHVPDAFGELILDP